MHAHVGAPQWRGSALQARAHTHAWLRCLGEVWNALLPVTSCRMGPAMQRMCTISCKRASLKVVLAAEHTAETPLCIRG